MSCFYKNEKHFLPNDNDEELIKEAIEREQYHQKGGSTSCGHDFHDKMKEADYGDVVMCTRCHQFFAKIKVLPWLSSQKFHPDFDPVYSTNHCGGAWYIPVAPRLSIDGR